MGALIQGCAREIKTIVGGSAHPNERRVITNATLFGNLEGAKMRERGGKKEEWTDCGQSDARAFDIYSGGLDSDGVEGRGRCGLRRPRRVGEGSRPHGGKKR